MLFPRELFQQAGLNSTDASNLFEVSRVTGWRWMRSQNRPGVNALIQKRVKQGALAVSKAMAAGDLPSSELTKLAPHLRIEALRGILSKHHPEK